MNISQNNINKLSEIVDIKDINLDKDGIYIYPTNSKLIPISKFSSMFKINNENQQILKSSEKSKEGYNESRSFNSTEKDISNKNSIISDQKDEKRVKMVKKVDFGRKSFNSISTDKLQEEYKKQLEALNCLKSKENETKVIDDINKFEKLSQKWLKISQDAVYSFLEEFPQNNNYEPNTIKKVLDYFKIDYNSIRFDCENECFLDN